MPNFQKHKLSKRTTIIIALVAFFVLLPITALAYVGFVPGLTELMQTNKPVDLGVRYSTADFEHLQQNALLSVSNFGGSDTAPKKIDNVTAGDKLVFFGPDTVQTTLSQAELTSFVNLIPWNGSPLSNSQLKLSDGTAEFSGNVRSGYVADLIKNAYPAASYGQLGFLVRLASNLHNPAVYVKFAVSATGDGVGPSHGQLNLKVLALKVNRMDLSGDVNKMKAINLTIPEGSYQQGTPYSLSTLTVSNGQLDFYGTIPAQFSVGGGDPSALCDQDHGGSLVSLDTANGHVSSALKYCQ